MKRWIARIMLGSLALMALALVVGATYEAMAHAELAERYPVPGRKVDIGGRSLHIDCRGTGSPTVVFESGLGSSGARDWSLVHDAVASMTRACGYSRAGILASDPAVGERDAEAVAEDLHTLLERAGEHPPLVLMAHSLGGLYALTYARKFAADVEGLVLVDILHPDSIRRMEAAGVHVPLPLGPLQLADRLRWTGLMRLLGPDDEEMAYELASLSGMRSELEALDRSLAQAGALRTLGGRPVSVLSSGQVEPEFLAEAQLTAEQGRKFLAVKRSSNEDLASWSSRGQHEVVPEATHQIQWQAPERVISAVRRVVDAVRAEPPR